MPQRDKLGELFLTSEDGLFANRYITTVDKLATPRAPRTADSGIAERQLKIVSQLSQLLTEREQAEKSSASSIKKDGQMFLSRDYNESFQMALQQIKTLGPNTRREDRMAAYSNMAHLGDDFHYTVRTYGRIIISEGKFFVF